MIHDIVGGLAVGESPGEMSYILRTVQDIIGEVHNSTASEGSTHPVEYILSDIIEKITSRQPTEEDPDGTKGILQCVAQQLHSSEVLLNPIAAVQQIICDVISNLQATGISTNEKQVEVKQVLDDDTGKLAAEGLANCTESVKNVIRELVENITYHRLALAESDITKDRSDSVVTEMESLGEFKEDTEQGKEILQKTGPEIISHGKEISESKEIEEEHEEG
jgi:hypothetical protein